MLGNSIWALYKPLLHIITPFNGAKIRDLGFILAFELFEPTAKFFEAEKYAAADRRGEKSF